MEGSTKFNAFLFLLLNMVVATSPRDHIPRGVAACKRELGPARQGISPRSVWVLVALVRGVSSVSRLWFSNEEIMIMMTVVITRIIMMIALNGEHVVDWVRVLFLTCVACRKRYRLYTCCGLVSYAIVRGRRRDHGRPLGPRRDALRIHGMSMATFARGLKPRALKILTKAHRISNIITINQNLSHRNFMFVIRWRIRKN